MGRSAPSSPITGSRKACLLPGKLSPMEDRATVGPRDFSPSSPGPLKSLLSYWRA